MKVGLIGASGCSGEVLGKLLLGYPNVTQAAGDIGLFFVLPRSTAAS